MQQQPPPVPRPPRRQRGSTDFELGCLWPLALVLIVAIAAGVFLLTRLQGGAQAPQETVIRVIDSSASPGPKVIGTAVIPKP